MNALVEETEEYPVVADGSHSLEIARVITVSWWHWFHRFTVWGDVFSSTTAGIMGAFTGGVGGPWWQSRSCVVCNFTQRRRVEVAEDRA